MCKQCFTVFSGPDQFNEHREGRFETHFQSCTSNSCRRWCKASEIRTDRACECVTTPEAQWREIFRAQYPDLEQPALTHSSPEKLSSSENRNDNGLLLAGLSSTEELDANPSGTLLNQRGDLTPSSSNVSASHPLRQVVAGLQQKIAGMESRMAELISGRSDLRTQTEALVYRNGVLEQSNKALHRQVRELEQLIGFLWAAFEDRLEPHSQMGIHMRTRVMETIPSVFKFLGTTVLDERTEMIIKEPAPIQDQPSYEPNEERGHAGALQQDATSFDVPPELEELFASDLQASSMASNPFDDLCTIPSFSN